jgi:hypothetical protein
MAVLLKNEPNRKEKTPVKTTSAARVVIIGRTKRRAARQTRRWTEKKEKVTFALPSQFIKTCLYSAAGIFFLCCGDRDKTRICRRGPELANHADFFSLHNDYLLFVVRLSGSVSARGQILDSAGSSSF